MPANLQILEFSVLYTPKRFLSLSLPFLLLPSILFSLLFSSLSVLLPSVFLCPFHLLPSPSLLLSSFHLFSFLISCPLILPFPLVTSSHSLLICSLLLLYPLISLTFLSVPFLLHQSSYIFFCSGPFAYFCLASKPVAIWQDDRMTSLPPGGVYSGQRCVQTDVSTVR